ncbi:uncharacterized protein LOC130306059 [Hyla sarda]|uniref:uncharacterized protein LOC130306059 n=1 Tax=Hyla sarda TaxID=327740 RepID=UPI0024C3A6AB|nr:uncharacterized protein LOC130306059 [Hyla sarda]
MTWKQRRRVSRMCWPPRIDLPKSLIHVLRLANPGEEEAGIVAEDMVVVACAGWVEIKGGQDESEITIDTDLLITMIEACSALGDSSDPHHAKLQYSQALWIEIYCAICNNWEDLSSTERWTVGKQIRNRWASIRDQHMRDIREEEERPSGSGASSKTPYYNRQLHGFLQKCHEMQKTHSSVRQKRAQTLQQAPPPYLPSPLTLLIRGKNLLLYQLSHSPDQVARGSKYPLEIWSGQ